MSSLPLRFRFLLVAGSRVRVGERFASSGSAAGFSWCVRYAVARGAPCPCGSFKDTCSRNRRDFATGKMSPRFPYQLPASRRIRMHRSFSSPSLYFGMRPFAPVQSDLMRFVCQGSCACGLLARLAFHVALL